MIEKLKGNIDSIEPTYCCMMVNGVGYGLHISLKTYNDLVDTASQNDLEAGGEWRTDNELYTYLHVRENILELYGFYLRDERKFFHHLIEISGIGPKTALRILSGASVGELSQYIAEENSDKLSKVRGIGKKKAALLITTLKEKIDVELPEDEGNSKLAQGLDKETISKAIKALMSLGLTATQARSGVDKTTKNHPNCTLDELIKFSLM